MRCSISLFKGWNFLKIDINGEELLNLFHLSSSDKLTAIIYKQLSKGLKNASLRVHTNSKTLIQRKEFFLDISQI